jgi:purine-binding chemotaxis protein CheW
MKRISAREKKVVVVEETLQIVTFRIGSEEYGLDIKSITEVIRPLKITPLPRMPEFVEGVINLRGVIIPVVDLRKRFSMGQTSDNARTVRIIIIRGAVAGTVGGTELLGLVVEAVHEVIVMPLKDIEAAPAGAVGRDVEFITGMGKVGERLIILLDVTRLLSRQERSALAEAGND